MNLPKAIEILELNVQSVGRQMPTDTLQAVKLGIEAIKRELQNRKEEKRSFIWRLPGED